MIGMSLHEKCKINTNHEGDSFVGINCSNGDIAISFPLGYRLDTVDDDRLLRKDILLLLRTLSELTSRTDSSIRKHIDTFEGAGFPIQAYMYVISDFLDRGYYKEREIRYEKNIRGQANWSKTIKQCKPYISENEAIYLRFITRKKPINENELITLVHEFCVYESFIKLGWLFTSAVPAKPRIPFNKRLFTTVLRSKSANTYNDKNKQLFQSMLAIINYIDNPNAGLNYRYGTNRFEYIWQDLIDYLYGVEGKELFYPQTTWHLTKENKDNSSLEPDSIMIYKENLFVLDAKYYQYGDSGNPSSLPQSADINKQITYGDNAERIRTLPLIQQRYGTINTVYNAFIMPFNQYGKRVSASTPYMHIGSATANWRTPHLPHEYVQGILVDVKFLMTQYHRKANEVPRLAEIIAASL